ncbi:MAG: hypothetical protein IPK67_19335 [Planctomycetes bacterium]|nr:hypothetical protein [Planctomycetota bacterium]
MRVRLVLGTSLVCVVLAAVAVAGAPSAPKVAAATAIRLPAEPEGADTWSRRAGRAVLGADGR